MRWRVTIRPAAEIDVQLARDWYEEQRPGLGETFLLAMAESFTRLEDSPLQCPVYYREFRRLLAHTFPYKVFFRIEGQDVIVYRVLHAAQEHSWRIE